MTKSKAKPVTAPPPAVFILQATHWFTPGQPMMAYATRADANTAAAAYVNLLRTDVDLKPTATTANWEASLLQARRKRARDLGIAVKAGASFDLDDDDADVWVNELAVSGATPPTIAIVLEGGMVQDIVTDRPGAVGDAWVIDYDTDGADAADLTDVTQGDGREEAAAVANHGAPDAPGINLAEVIRRKLAGAPSQKHARAAGKA
jgi:hypothetical protein